MHDGLVAFTTFFATVGPIETAAMYAGITGGTVDYSAEFVTTSYL